MGLVQIETVPPLPFLLVLSDKKQSTNHCLLHV